MNVACLSLRTTKAGADEYQVLMLERHDGHVVLRGAVKAMVAIECETCLNEAGLKSGRQMKGRRFTEMEVVGGAK